MVARQPPEKAERETLARRDAHRRVLDRDHRVLVLQAPPRQAVPRHQRLRHLPRTTGQTMNLHRIGRERFALTQRADQAPRVTPARREVLPRGDDAASLAMHERRVIDVLADVVLVQPHRAVRRERKVLRIDQVDVLRRIAAVVQLHVPEPRRRVVRQHQPHAVLQPLPGTGARQRVAARDTGKTRRAARPEQRGALQRRVMPAQVQVRRPALELVADEQIDDEVTAVDTADRAVRVDLRAQARSTAQVRDARSCCWRTRHAGSTLGACRPARRLRKRRPGPAV